jgi:hypothetical protein
MLQAPSPPIKKNGGGGEITSSHKLSNRASHQAKQHGESTRGRKCSKYLTSEATRGRKCSKYLTSEAAR